MAVITMPTGGIARVSWTNPVHPDFTVKSRWTGKTQIVDLGATDGFRAQVEIIPGTTAHLLAWRAFFAGLRGRTNTFYLRPGATVTAVAGAVNGGSQTGYTVNVDGFTASSTIALAGALVHIATASTDHRMFTLTANLTTNGSGQAAMAIEPNIVTAYADNAVVQVGTPQCHMRLATPVTGWGEDPGDVNRPFSFECEEVI